MSSKKYENFGLILVAIIFLGIGFLFGSVYKENQMLKAGAQPTAAQPTADAAQPTQKADTTDQMPDITKDDHIRGAKNPKIYLVEYSDYECTFCAKFHPTIEQIMEKYGDDIAWVYRHYPLSFHQNAQPSAETAECIAKAGGNDAFWKFTDEIFTQNTNLGGKLNQDAIDAAIAASGVSAESIQNCIESGEMTEVVTQQQTGGAKAGVSGTPGTILMTADGEYELISGALPYAQVEQIIEKYLK